MHDGRTAMNNDGAGAREHGGAGNNGDSSGAVDQQHGSWNHAVSARSGGASARRWNSHE